MASNLQKQESQMIQNAERTRSGKVFLPPTDIIENQSEILLLCDMPGVHEKSINITLEDDVLKIEGCVTCEKPSGGQVQYREYEVGDYLRSFTLNDTVDREHIEASYNNGVLRLVIPKAEKAKPRKIEVKSR